MSPLENLEEEESTADDRMSLWLAHLTVGRTTLVGFARGEENCYQRQERCDPKYISHDETRFRKMIARIAAYCNTAITKVGFSLKYKSCSY